jgi:hypothetical protein
LETRLRYLETVLPLLQRLVAIEVAPPELEEKNLSATITIKGTSDDFEKQQKFVERLQVRWKEVDAFFPQLIALTNDLVQLFKVLFTIMLDL